ncbi:MAG: glycosyltransferase [Clostridia bacterium]|nr:glycosyltransferase [Clostridia bacterium]
MDNGVRDFSVLMAVYYKENAQYFDLALNSIFEKQTVKPSEFVLVCDGPLGEDLNGVIEKYQSEYPEVFRVYRTEKNQGLGNALNYGLERCSHNLVARADSDDVCCENRFEEQIKYMAEHQDVSVVSSYIDEFETDWAVPIRKKELPLTHKELVEMAKFRNPINHMAVMFRRDDIMEIGSYHHLLYLEDYELWVRAIIDGKKLGNIGKVLVHARAGREMLARRGNKEYIKSWRVLSKYMLTNGMINKFQYVRNMIAIRAFVCLSLRLRKKLYGGFLRKKLNSGYSKK